MGVELFIPEMDEKDIPENPPAVQLLSVNFMKRFQFLPVNDSGEKLQVMMADPLDFNTREIIRSTYSRPIDVFRASGELVSQYLYRWYEADADMTGEEDADSLDLSLEDALWDDPEQLKGMASEAPVIRMVNHVINRALELGVSDIHIEPRRHNVLVRYRIDGVLHDQESIAPRLKAAIISRVKLMAKLDIAERRLPQDGRIKIRAGHDEVDIRVSTVPTHFGESIVLRLLNKENVSLDLKELGFNGALLKRFRSVISTPFGILLVTGPTGSGKTTTLYAALNEINTPDKKIVTVEDPVEYQMDGVNQVQVHSSIGLTFASTLRSFLRHDPDVMLVGEIRDGETAEIAVQAALTGHMVFSTLHTNDAAGAVTRLEDMGIERFMISSSLVGVLAQRLVRKNCRHCSRQVTLTEEQRQGLASDFSVAADILPFSYFRGDGCKLCGETGYKGRVGIFELMVLDEDIQGEIVAGSDRNRIFKKAVEKGMASLKMDGLAKVADGVTTYEEVLRVSR
ncbi:general secretory pathway component, cryptic [Desulfamplus magnetovallimortis]|uniref:General secretory pathway component, cryptic n=1 Tax=Desulfamplus magnetovallimortis TaxID=1246637 RepID=A0A1W1HD06_9BACT|nr:GspE/PulE family protein [Desulfamplus magnetovallimortis]SLM30381.1 general secretory pathway component, cryptic [Desulfamplus magnetovallimortis]